MCVCFAFINVRHSLECVMVSVHALNSSDDSIVLNGNLSASAVIEETTRKRELRLLKNRYLTLVIPSGVESVVDVVQLSF